ncbi:MAG TPA: oxidoreductase [Gemmatimonadales bacterium]
MSRTIVLAGATGLVGRECLRFAARDPAIAKVYALVRRFVHPSAQPQRVEYRIIDFNRLDDVTLPPPVDAVVCTLGTTLKQAGSREAFSRVDYEYVLALAQRGLGWGARHFLLVSALWANPRSHIFYCRMKGEIEAAVGSLPYQSVTILRPSVLAGQRAKPRVAEQLFRRIGGLLPSRYRAVTAARVAAALLAAVNQPRDGLTVLDNGVLRDTPLPSSTGWSEQVT